MERGRAGGWMGGWVDGWKNDCSVVQHALDTLLTGDAAFPPAHSVCCAAALPPPSPPPCCDGDFSGQTGEGGGSCASIGRFDARLNFGLICVQSLSSCFQKSGIDPRRHTNELTPLARALPFSVPLPLPRPAPLTAAGSEPSIMICSVSAKLATFPSASTPRRL